MKVDDIVRFTREHASKPGFDYCADWIGIVLRFVPLTTAKIFWSTPHGPHICDYGQEIHNLEVVDG